MPSGVSSTPAAGATATGMSDGKMDVVHDELLISRLGSYRLEHEVVMNKGVRLLVTSQVGQWWRRVRVPGSNARSTS